MANDEAENDTDDSDDPEEGQEQYRAGEEDIDVVEQTELMNEEDEDEDEEEDGN